MIINGSGSSQQTCVQGKWARTCRKPAQVACRVGEPFIVLELHCSCMACDRIIDCPSAWGRNSPSPPSPPNPGMNAWMHMGHRMASSEECDRHGPCTRCALHVSPGRCTARCAQHKGPCTQLYGAGGRCLPRATCEGTGPPRMDPSRPSAPSPWHPLAADRAAVPVSGALLRQAVQAGRLGLRAGRMGQRGLTAPGGREGGREGPRICSCAGTAPPTQQRHSPTYATKDVPYSLARAAPLQQARQRRVLPPPACLHVGI